MVIIISENLYINLPNTNLSTNSEKVLIDFKKMTIKLAFNLIVIFGYIFSCLPWKWNLLYTSWLTNYAVVYTSSLFDSWRIVACAAANLASGTR